jgi:hypothetical protein
VAWLIAEGDALFAAINQAAATARTGEQLLPAGDLLVAMEPLMESGTHTREFDQGTRAVLAAAQAIGDPAGELRARYVLGRVLFAGNRLKEAEEQFRRVPSACSRCPRGPTSPQGRRPPCCR